MKKIITGILTTTAVLSLAACGCSNSKKEATKSSSSSSSVVKKSSESSSSKVASSEQSENNSSQAQTETEENTNTEKQEATGQNQETNNNENNNNTSTPESKDSHIPKTDGEPPYDRPKEVMPQDGKYSLDNMIGHWSGKDEKTYLNVSKMDDGSYAMGQQAVIYQTVGDATSSGNILSGKYKFYDGKEGNYTITINSPSNITVSFDNGDTYTLNR